MSDRQAPIARYAAHPCPVLILGATGTGKELVAEALHRRSARQGRFMAQNAAQLSAELADSLLFGHVRGAFTGADADRPGRVREAEGGTFFLDEVFDLAPAVQGKLLRALNRLEEGVVLVEPVGATAAPIPVHTRLVVSALADPREDPGVAGASAMRADLYYRVAVGVIRLPTLAPARAAGGAPRTHEPPGGELMQAGNPTDERGSPARRPVAAVVGGQRGSDALLACAEAIGQGLVDAGFFVATGGRGGVMEAASRGGRAAAGWSAGAVIGVLPSLRAGDANPYVDLVIPTGLNYARNTLLVAMADVVIAVGGGSGTLSEIALAWQHDKPIIALDRGEGWSASLAGRALDDRRDDVIHRAVDAADAVRLARRLAGSRRGSDGFAGS